LKTLLIDGDWLLWSVTQPLEHEVEWSPGQWVLFSNSKEASAKAEERIDELLAKLEAADVRIAFTDYFTPNWRFKVLPTYKAHRKNGRKPLVYWPVREHLAATYNTMTVPTLEADDILGIWATDSKVKGEKVLVGEDKDFESIPGNLWNPNKEDLGVRTISLAEADRFHLFQTLTGDATDGYSGCPGVGPVRAERALGDAPSWDRVVAAYAKAGLEESAALVQARVARILRHKEFSFKTNIVKLWEPANALLR
jgi:DNA polymerase-1